MKPTTLEVGTAIVILCSDEEGTYTWVAPNIERAREFVKENASTIYDYDKPMELLFADGEWTDFGYFRYMLDILEIV